MTLKMQRTHLSLFKSVKDPTWKETRAAGHLDCPLNFNSRQTANVNCEFLPSDQVFTFFPFFCGKMLYVYDFLKRENRKRLKLKTGQNPTTTTPLPLVAPKIKSSRALNVTWRPRKRPLAMEDHMIVFWARKHNRLPPHPTGMTDFDKKCSYTQILPDR